MERDERGIIIIFIFCKGTIGFWLSVNGLENNEK